MPRSTRGERSKVWAAICRRDTRGIVTLVVERATRRIAVPRSPGSVRQEPPLLGLLVGEPDGGRLGLVVDRIHHAVLAIRAEIPLAVLRDTIAQFPTYSESYVIALRTLPGKASGAH